MLKHISGLFRRYLHQHSRIIKPGFDLTGNEGASVGVVEFHQVHQDRYIVSGWIDADEVGITLGASKQVLKPSISRDDVIQARPDIGHHMVGFELNVPFEPALAEFWFSRKSEKFTYFIKSPNLAEVRAAKRRMLWPFLRDLTKASPSIMHWIFSKSSAARAHIKTVLGFNAVTHSQTLESDLFERDPSDEPPVQSGISIVLPVYNAFDLLEEVIDRVTRNTDLPWRLIVIEDCSSDARVRPWLRQWHERLEPKDRARVTLLENEKNKGFVGSVNRGFKKALPHGEPLVLLNSDALVPPGWASRLIGPLLQEPQVASVTPMSNDAEIFSAPVICQRSDLAPGAGDAIDHVAKSFNTGVVLKDVPTGVGFCMAMHYDAFRLLPEFDTCFGRGYGEEVNWCLQLAKRGWRHLGHGGVFVEHRGGAAFGSEQKRALVRENNRIITQRYPEYNQMVQDFISSDPLSSPRLALALAGMGAKAGTAKVPIYLAHNLGGGAEQYLQSRIAGDLIAGKSALVLRVGGKFAWQIELHDQKAVIHGATNDTNLMMKLMQVLPRRAVIYSCGVGAAYPMKIPQTLQELGQGTGQSLEILFHDYLPISPSYTLLNSKAEYDGPPDPGQTTDPAHHGHGQCLPAWQKGWGAALKQADQITVFSESSQEIVAQAYPKIAGKIRIIPHKLLQEVPEVSQTLTKPRSGTDPRPAIGVLGNIGLQKGAAVLQDLSRHLAQTGDARLVVIGDIDPSYALASPAQVHGSYQVGDIPALVKRYGISQWFIPSVWPETFSYTTHEALATGLPVWCFDLGAQAEAVTKASATQGQGGVIPLGAKPVELMKRIDLGLENAQGHN